MVFFFCDSLPRDLTDRLRGWVPLLWWLLRIKPIFTKSSACTSECSVQLLWGGSVVSCLWRSNHLNVQAWPTDWALKESEACGAPEAGSLKPLPVSIKHHKPHSTLCLQRKSSGVSVISSEIQSQKKKKQSVSSTFNTQRLLFEWTFLCNLCTNVVVGKSIFNERDQRVATGLTSSTYKNTPVSCGETG